MQRKLTFLVVGAGGVGGYYGGRLAAAGLDVTFKARGDTLAALQQQGLRVHSTNGDFHIASVQTVEHTTQPRWDVIILATKVNQTDTVLEEIAPAVDAQTMLVSLQNGVDNEAKLATRFPESGIIGGIAFIGAQILEPAVIEHRASGHLILGPWRPQDQAATDLVAEAFQFAGIQTRIEADILAALWSKLLWNAAFNTASCLSGADVMDVLDAPGGEAAVRAIMQEVADVAGAEGVTLPENTIEDYIRHTRDLNWTTTSMRIDREAGHPIEAGAITGTALCLAEKHGIAVPRLQLLNAMLVAYNRNVGR